MYTAHIRITLRPSILDPEGKAVQSALHSLGMADVEEVRTGRFIEMQVAASSSSAAEAVVHGACQKLLANPVTEDYEITALVHTDGQPA